MCFYGEKCKFLHDVADYMSTKPADLGDTCYIYDTFGRCNINLDINSNITPPITFHHQMECVHDNSTYSIYINVTHYSVCGCVDVHMELPAGSLKLTQALITKTW